MASEVTHHHFHHALFTRIKSLSLVYVLEERIKLYLLQGGVSKYFWTCFNLTGVFCGWKEQTSACQGFKNQTGAQGPQWLEFLGLLAVTPSSLWLRCSFCIFVSLYVPSPFSFHCYMAFKSFFPTILNLACDSNFWDTPWFSTLGCGSGGCIFKKRLR